MFSTVCGGISGRPSTAGTATGDPPALVEAQGKGSRLGPRLERAGTAPAVPTGGVPGSESMFSMACIRISGRAERPNGTLPDHELLAHPRTSQIKDPVGECGPRLGHTQFKSTADGRLLSCGRSSMPNAITPSVGGSSRTPRPSASASGPPTPAAVSSYRIRTPAGAAASRQATPAASRSRERIGTNVEHTLGKGKIFRAFSWRFWCLPAGIPALARATIRTKFV